MKNKNTLKKISVMALCFTFAMSTAACGEGMITTNSEKDMKQVLATIDITNHEKFTGDGTFAPYASVVKNLNSKIYKRDLIAYFLNVGSNYVQNYGYKETFNMLMQNLVGRKIMVQYAMAHYFSTGDFTVDAYNTYVESETTAADEKVKVHYEAHPEILTMKYFITDGGKNTADYDEAVYSLKYMLNQSLDASEKEFIKEKDDKEEESTETRTLPTNANKQDEDYYSKDYDFYTGLNTLDSCGEYEVLEGSTQTTRKKAYNAMLTRLTANNLIGKKENTTDFMDLDYYYVELAGQLEQALITKYSDDLDDKAVEELEKEYVESKYVNMKANQEMLYVSDQTAFGTKLDSVSDSTFLLYSPKAGFGFVDNILLPFNETQKQKLSIAKKDNGLTESEKQKVRADLLQEVKGTDLRAPWFSSNKDKNYSFKATGEDKIYKGTDDTREYLFFENNLKKSDGENAKYEDLGQYYGAYSYNGKVEKDENGKYICTPNELNIDKFITEMESYLTFAGLTASGTKSAGYVTDGNYNLTDDKFDYKEFVYYEGKVTLPENTKEARSNYFLKTEDAYKAVSVINELMFAYSTDPGCLNKYMGYSVSPYKTSFMPEFEFAAQYAIGQGVGNYVVAPTDYGWHVIYVTFVYDEGEVYTFNWEERNAEGTFSYIFYESLKSNNSNTVYASMVQNQILTDYNNETCVKIYEDRYEDLLSLDEKN